ncbi:MAG: sirohydrochlorin cobaltochelatase, partial [Lachnospiraceae bacterium]|nr:sirohydrochlorin cobaltochelatase [Lachnospiraceae bacterium]
MKKELAVLLTAVLGTAFLAGCGSSDGPTATLQNKAGTTPAVSEAVSVESAPEETATATTPAETENAASVSAEDAAAEGDQIILVVSFGTSYNESRDLTIGAIENAIAEEFPEYEVRRAFTSQIIIDKLAARDGLVIDNVEEALERAVADGIKTLVVQPTHLMSGYEYTDLADALEDY